MQIGGIAVAYLVIRWRRSRQMSNKPNRYSQTDKALGYLALLLIGLMGWIGDRIPLSQAYVSSNKLNQGVSK
jgi:hypothetical protein